MDFWLAAYKIQVSGSKCHFTSISDLAPLQAGEVPGARGESNFLHLLACRGSVVGSWEAVIEAYITRRWQVLLSTGHVTTSVDDLVVVWGNIKIGR